MPERPLSILTKGQRNSLELLDTDALLFHYEDVYASRFRWLGGPEGMDPSWPERMLFRFGLLGYNHCDFFLDPNGTTPADTEYGFHLGFAAAAPSFGLYYNF